VVLSIIVSAHYLPFFLSFSGTLVDPLPLSYLASHSLEVELVVVSAELGGNTLHDQCSNATVCVVDNLNGYAVMYARYIEVSMHFFVFLPL